METERDLEEMSLLWEKGTSWRWLVRRTRESNPFFIAFATICGIVPEVIGYNSSDEAGLARKLASAFLA
ncbi:hypothetical protein CFP56_037393 [Quercus suber]|uniref:Uncharacterized protein n=1 Tax=Quercus suber TaxID=58331 RepID=A0AAW0LQE6_QUESU